MCFTVPAAKCKLQKAEQDIIVYKIVTNLKYKRYFWHPWDKYLASVKSSVRGFIYKVYLYNIPIKLAPLRRIYSFYIEEGYHSYGSLQKAKCEYPGLSWYIIKCIIPKGSFYYEYGELYVSSNIIITDEICVKQA